jgi:hypothetical protein
MSRHFVRHLAFNQATYLAGMGRWRGEDRGYGLKNGCETTSHMRCIWEHQCINAINMHVLLHDNVTTSSHGVEEKCNEQKRKGKLDQGVEEN